MPENDVMYSRAESRFCASFDFVIDVFNLRSDGGKVVPVQVVEPDHEGQEYQQECHHELHYILKHTSSH